MATIEAEMEAALLPPVPSYERSGRQSERSWTTMDKSAWGEGPWLGEPDKVQWVDEATGLPCLAVRAPMGHWCGYVGVPEGHPLYQMSDSHAAVEGLQVHGSITFTESCQTGDEARAICHIPEEGMPDRVWWLGFDCGHSWDLSPGIISEFGPIGPTMIPQYRTLDYVQETCADLARQLAAVANPEQSAQATPPAQEDR